MGGNQAPQYPSIPQYYPQPNYYTPQYAPQYAQQPIYYAPQYAPPPVYFNLGSTLSGLIPGIRRIVLLKRGSAGLSCSATESRSASSISPAAA